MGHYANAAEHYDLLYAGIKDYEAEAGLLAGLIREALPSAKRVLDVRKLPEALRTRGLYVGRRAGEPSGPVR